VAEITKDPTVAEFNSNVFKAAVRSGLDPAAATQIQQLSWTQKKAKELLRMSPEKAREEFLKLDPIVKSNINYLYPNNNSFAPELNPNLGGRILKRAGDVLSTAIKGYFSPITEVVELAGKYSQGLGTPYATKRQTEQGVDFSKKLLSDMYDGKNSWNWEIVGQYEEKYGKAITTLARAYAEGRTTGEAIDLNGKVDAEFLQAISFSRDNPKSFQQIKDSLKQDAQISPGRDYANKLFAKAEDGDYWSNVFIRLLQDKNYVGMPFDTSTPEGKAKAEKVLGKPWAQIERERKSAISGKVDAVYRLLTDPLSYIGIGAPLKATVQGVGGIKVGAKEAFQRFGGLKSKGEKLADQFLFVSERKGMQEGYAWLFNDVPEVKKLWDEQLGPDIKRFAEAKTDTEKGIILRAMKNDYPEWYDTAQIRKFAKAEVFDAPSAQEYFTKVDDTFAILNGNVDGISFTRNTIPYARRSRLLTSAVSKTAYDFFNRKTPLNEINAAEVERLDALDILTKVGQKEGELVNPEIEDIFKINTSIKQARLKALEWATGKVRGIGRAATRTPGPILWGEDADKTANSIRSTLSLIFEKDTAEALTITLLDAPQDTQLTVIRNAQYAFMMQLGIPKEDALGILNRTYNETSLGLLNRTPVSPEIAAIMNKAAIQYENEVPYLVSKGAIFPSQLKGGIAPLPFDELYQLSTKGTLQRIGDKNEKSRALLLMFNGLTRNSLVAKWNNGWAGYTLFPRLGMRTNVDEMFMASITQPTEMLMGWATAKGSPTLAAQTALTGSSAAIGMYKGGFYKLAGGIQSGFYWLANKLGVTLNGKPIDPRKVLKPEDRAQIVRETQLKVEAKVGHPVPLSEISAMEIRDNLVSRIEDLYKTKNVESWKNLKKIAKHSNVFGNSLIASMGARHTLSSRIPRDYLDEQISANNIDLALEQMGLRKLKDYRSLQASDLNEKQITTIMYDNFPIVFGFNEQAIVPGRYYTPVSVFFRNNALKTEVDVRAAKTELLDQVGVKYYAANKYVELENADVVKAFISPYGQTPYLRQQGLSDAEIAETLVDTMLGEMRIAFHGSEKGFNQKLFDLITERHNEIIKVAPKLKKPQAGAWSRAVTTLNFDEFQEATRGFRPITGELNTRLVSMGEDVDLKKLETVTGLKGWLEILTPGQLMQLMDRQVTGFTRQPLLLAAMDAGFRKIKPFEKLMLDRHKASIKELNPQWSDSRIEELAQDLAEKQSVEIVTNQAVNTVLQYVDNPNVRSNFALSIRHLGRFYRATEDFHRRVYRAYTKQTLRSFYRLRIVSMGLQNMGSVYTDDNGDDYIIFPTDMVLNSIIQPVMRQLSGDDSFKVPSSTNFAIKWRLINPSFAPDAGAPAFAGPVAGVMIQSLKAYLRELPLVPFKDFWSPYAERAADFLDRFAMGHIGQNTGLTDALRSAVPMMFTTALDLAAPAETAEVPGIGNIFSRNKANLVIQGMAYLQAQGNGLPLNATTEEQHNYIKNLKIAANNISFMQSFLGYFVSPGFPTLKETGTVPDYLKEVGIASPVADFWDIYEGIKRNDPDANLSDLFDRAVATFVGKNPGKVIYTIPRSDKKMRVFLNKTENLKKWAQNNEKFINVYGETAFIFAPTIGEYNSDIYAWMEASGYVKRTDMESYLDAIQVAEDKQTYFAISDEEKKQLASAIDYTERKQIINKAENNRRLLLQSNPKLRTVLESGEDRGTLIDRLKSLNDAITSPNTPIPSQIRSVMQIATKEVARMIELDNNQFARNSRNFTDQKRALKQEIETVLKDLSGVSPEVKEASRLIFVPLLNEYSRDITSASPRG
jgi:hypothetical protein